MSKIFMAELFILTKEMNDQEFFSLENVVIRDCAADTAGGIAVQSGNLNSVNVSIFDTYAGHGSAVYCRREVPLLYGLVVF